MSRIVRCSLIQATNAAPPEASLEATKKAMVDKHVAYIEQAAKAGAQIVCLQEIFYGPYFCAEQTTRWYDFTEPIPDGPTIRLMQDLAKQHHIALIVPIYEIEQDGLFYNTAAVIHNDGTYLGKYRKTHIPHVAPGFWEKFSIPLFAYYYIWFSHNSWARAKKDLPAGRNLFEQRPGGDAPSDPAGQIGGHHAASSSAGRTPRSMTCGSAADASGCPGALQARHDLPGPELLPQPLPVSEVAADFITFRDEFAASPVFFRVDGKPLTIWSGTWAVQLRPGGPGDQRRCGRGLLVLSTEKNVARLPAHRRITDGDAYYWSSVNPATNSGYAAKLDQMSQAIQRR